MGLPFHADASWKIFENARSLKKVMTPAKIIWQNLRNRKVSNQKFRRQHPIARYIVDFYCHEAKLVIEVDGGIHLHRRIFSMINLELKSWNPGLKVIGSGMRGFGNISNIDGDQKAPHPWPSPTGRVE